MSFTVRRIVADEVPAFSDAMAIGFNRVPDPAQAEVRRPGIDLDRTFAAFDGDAVVGTSRSFPTPLTLPGGGEVVAAAVTNVTVAPTHRRRGVLTEMMRQQMDDAVDRGEPVAILIASEAAIYGRFGYGVATRSASLRLDRQRARFRARPASADAVRLVDRQDLRQIAPVVYDAHRRAQSGAIGRHDRTWDFIFGLVEGAPDEAWKKRLHVVHDSGSGPDGYASYRFADDWDHRTPDNKLHVDELVAVGDDAYAALWHYLLALDWVVTVIAEERPAEEPLPWLLTDPRQVELVHLSDFLWARVLDVPAALAGRTYGADDTLVLDVHDDQPPFVAGRFRLEASIGGPAACEGTDAEPDLTVPASVLGAALLGGSPVWPAAYAGLVAEHTVGAVERFDRLFLHQPPPWCNTWF
jgi:predicted acetyltransferase